MSTTISTEDYSVKEKEFIEKIEKELQKEKASKTKYIQSNQICLPNKNFYTQPVQIYIKYKRDRNTFKQLYARNKLNFYFTLQKKQITKFIKRSLPYSLISLILSATTFHLLSISGFYKFLYRVWTYLRNIFKRN